MNNKFSERLKEIRKSKGINQKDCAYELKAVFGEPVECSKYNKWENGTNSPDFDAVCNLAKFFETTTDYLLGAADEETLMEIPELVERKTALIHDIHKLKMMIREINKILDTY